ncbi:MAG TPA: hypothetical protein VK069_04185 [Mycolicibacillus parakoreensis]|nr:hypothetical protein [Mycolicibacillus parakoreensis]
MSTDPDQIRTQIDALLAPLPDGDDPALADSDLAGIARRLSEAHDVLVQALESVEKG